MKRKEYNSAPLPFQGQKRKFAKEFAKILQQYPDDTVFVDLIYSAVVDCCRISPSIKSQTLLSCTMTSTTIASGWHTYRKQMNCWRQFVKY